MYRHEIWSRVLMHEDDELAKHIGSEIAERVTIHEWPLSCVQRITTGDGRKLIYKAQGGRKRMCGVGLLRGRAIKTAPAGRNPLCKRGELLHAA